MSNPVSNSVVLGTRGSRLALVQADAATRALAVAFPDLEIQRRVIRTTGDRRTDVSLAEVARAEGTFDKGVFIKEIEEALAAGEIDIAVHSLKDLPTTLDGRFELAAVLERAAARDVWLSRHESAGGIETLPPGARVGTSSVRRARQVVQLRPDLEVVDLRGNVPTRLEKLAAGDGGLDAIVLAEAGLVRLGFLGASPEAGAREPVAGMPGLVAVRLAEEVFHPAAGQGAVGLEIRAGDGRTRALAGAIGDPATWSRVTAEREFLRLLDGGCHTPVGVFSVLENGILTLKARVFPESGGDPRCGVARGADPLATALELYQSLT